MRRPGKPSSSLAKRNRYESPRDTNVPRAFSFLKPIETGIGDRIRVLRKKKRWLQRERAKAAGLPLRMIGRIERGQVDVRLSTLAKIAHALGVTLTDLVQ